MNKSRKRKHSVIRTVIAVFKAALMPSASAEEINYEIYLWENQ